MPQSGTISPHHFDRGSSRLVLTERLARRDKESVASDSQFRDSLLTLQTSRSKPPGGWPLCASECGSTPEAGPLGRDLPRLSTRRGIRTIVRKLLSLVLVRPLLVT